MFIVSTGDDATLAKIPPQLTPGDNFMTNFNIVMGNIPDGTQSFAYAHFGASFLYSTIVTVTITVSTLFFCSLAGFAFSKLKFKGRDPLGRGRRRCDPGQWAWSRCTSSSAAGWQGRHRAIVPAFAPPWRVHMRQFIQDALRTRSSSRHGRASTFRIFWTSLGDRPALGVLGLLTAVGAWNEFQWALIALGPGTENPTVGVALSKLASAQYPRPRISLAGSLLATIPLLVLLAVAGKQIVRGVMEGALKH